MGAIYEVHYSDECICYDLTSFIKTGSVMPKLIEWKHGHIDSIEHNPTPLFKDKKSSLKLHLQLL